MIKKLIISISCLLTLCGGIVFAENKTCQNETNAYCVDVDVKNSQKPANINNDLCYVLQINASDQFISGSLSMSQLPAAIFEIAKNETLSGKPLNFKIVKAEIVPSGQCNANQASLEHVNECEVFEYAALAGVSRSIILIPSRKTGNFTCEIN